MRRNLVALTLYFAVLFLATVAVYRKPIFEDNFDVFPYLGCVHLHSSTDASTIHHATYAEAEAHIPSAAYATLATEASEYRRDIASNPLHFAEILPFYNGRFLFVELVAALHFGPLHMPPLAAIAFVSACSYLVLGTILFVWLARYLEIVYSAPFAILLMLSAPIMRVGRTPTPDALSAVFVVLALFLGLETRSPFWCCLLLLVSIFVRTDNVILAAAMIFYFAFLSEKNLSMPRLHATTLLFLAAGSVLLIDRCSGSYGWAMLFHHTFISAVTNPAETLVRVSPKEYIVQLVSGSLSKSSSMILFIIVGAIGLLASSGLKTSRTLRDLGAILFAVTAMRYVLFPSLLDRHYAAFYIVWSIVMFVGLAPVLGIARAENRERLPAMDSMLVAK